MEIVETIMLIYLQMLDTPEEKIRFEQIYMKYRGLMYHVAENILHDSQEAEDAVHNAFLWIIKNFSKFQDCPRKDIAPMVTVIAKNEAISLLRKRKNNVPLEEWDGFVETLNDTTDYQDLVNSFQRLPQTYRVVMEMKLLMGCSDGEIAAKLCLSKTAVSTRVSRGRQLLRKIVEREGFRMNA